MIPHTTEEIEVLTALRNKFGDIASADEAGCKTKYWHSGAEKSYWVKPGSASALKIPSGFIGRQLIVTRQDGYFWAGVMPCEYCTNLGRGIQQAISTIERLAGE